MDSTSQRSVLNNDQVDFQVRLDSFVQDTPIGLDQGVSRRLPKHRLERLDIVAGKLCIGRFCLCDHTLGLGLRRRFIATGSLRFPSEFNRLDAAIITLWWSPHLMAIVGCLEICKAEDHAILLNLVDDEICVARWASAGGVN